MSSFLSSLRGVRTNVLGQVVDIPKHLRKDEQHDPIKVLVLRQDRPGQEEIYYVRADGTFSIEGLTVGSHIVQLACNRFEFAKVRIDVSKSGKMRAIAMVPSSHPSLYSSEEERKAAVASVDGFGFVKQNIPVEPILKIRPLNALNYFEVVPPMDYLGLLKNPMVIMLVVGVLVSVVFPKLVDPEAMKEAQKSMSQGEGSFRDLMNNLNGAAETTAANAITGQKKKPKKD
ncbi:predicted protein [Naegleria gruberi]|uniref:Predicted protein n=1 Tax=Naegleria gruberi TaxID=5762 RepID=D2VKY7_NAEGR|nr:uncharacterized protein NAEGRDRAFT_69597 [Naegleria gruberi]EFC42448.1 predicted protein [Naegleria gruberi]|eukprot:XP_002675192.1 predicted protein [Naegleria gruberi strain NEG-M]